MKYTVLNALELARNIIHGPLPPAEAPVPDVNKAIAAIEAHPDMRSFNWLTGQAAVAVLRKSLKEGPDAAVEVVPGVGVCA